MEARLLPVFFFDASTSDGVLPPFALAGKGGGCVDTGEVEDEIIVRGVVGADVDLSL